MAVMFVISYNVALENREDKKWPVYGEKKKEEPITLADADEERMDIIGQNGNDGLHYEELENDNEVSVDKGLLKKIIGQAKSTFTLRGREESEMNRLEKKI